MRRASVLSGVAFRTALLFMLVFAVVLGITGYAILRSTQGLLEAQIRASITEDVELMRDANIAGGQRELLHFIRDTLATRADREFAFALYTTEGRPIAGNIVGGPHFRGWGHVQIAQSPGQHFTAYAAELEDSVVVVGRSRDFVHSISSAIVNVLIVAGLVIGVSALAIGYALSHRVSAKLAVIDRTLEEVSRGNSEIRLPVGRSNDQIDHVSGQINAHLDRLSEFMASMRNTIVAIAHDLKSPLNRVNILLQDAASERDPQKGMERLEQAQQEMDTLRGVLDTVLRISRIETSDDSSGFAPFSPLELVRDLAQTFEPVLEAEGQTLRWDDLPETAPAIFGDRKMLQQALVNLIENASRYAGANTAIELTVGERNGGATIAIADNGPGIPAERREEVFQPFTRLDAERSRPGAGLGLALVKAVIVRHHAQVELGDNQPGLRVVLSFPAPPTRPPKPPYADV